MCFGLFNIKKNKRLNSHAGMYFQESQKTSPQSSSHFTLEITAWPVVSVHHTHTRTHPQTQKDRKGLMSSQWVRVSYWVSMGNWPIKVHAHLLSPLTSHWHEVYLWPLTVLLVSLNLPPSFPHVYREVTKSSTCEAGPCKNKTFLTDK